MIWHFSVMEPFIFLTYYNLVCQRDNSLKNENSVIIFSPSCRVKVRFIMLVRKTLLEEKQCCRITQTMEVNGVSSFQMEKKNTQLRQCDCACEYGSKLRIYIVKIQLKT